MSDSSNRVVYTLANIASALLTSEVPGILAIPLNETIYVTANEWKECLTRISELSGSKWIKRRNRIADGLVMGETRSCHRRGQYTPSRSIRICQKDSKKIGCNASLSILQFQSNPSVVELKLLTGHVNHVPGEDEDVRTLPLTKETAEMIESQLRTGINCSDTRAAVLRQVEHWEIGQRKPTYVDVYNRVRKIKKNLHRFDQDNLNSLSTCVDRQLPPEDQVISTREVIEDSDEDIDIEGESEAEASTVSTQMENAFTFVDEADVDCGTESDVEDMEDVAVNPQNEALVERVLTLMQTIHRQRGKVEKLKRLPSSELPELERLIYYLECFLKKMDGIVASHPHIYKDTERQ